MRQVRLTDDQFDELQQRGFMFTSKSYYWLCSGENIANRVSKKEFLTRDAAEPLQGVEQVRVYRKINPVDWDV